MSPLFLLTLILQIANGISSDFTGDWVRDVNPNGKILGKVIWRISIAGNHLKIAQSLLQGEESKELVPPHTTTYNLDGTHIKDYSGPIPERMSIDPLRQHWLKIKNANEVELTTVTVRGIVAVSTLTVSKDALKVVTRFGAQNEVVYSFRRATNPVTSPP